ncbi:hypothetical protein [Microbacterium sp.]|uniref:hypothetical protein n=1 Tax=Microbacterium sp. TaxID=51671 RepID=UPI003A86A772
MLISLIAALCAIAGTLLAVFVFGLDLIIGKVVLGLSAAAAAVAVLQYIDYRKRTAASRGNPD